MPTKRSDEPQSVDRRRFLGASVSTAALPFVGARLDEAFAEPVALAPSDSRVLVATARERNSESLRPAEQNVTIRRMHANETVRERGVIARWNWYKAPPCENWADASAEDVRESKLLTE